MNFFARVMRVFGSGGGLATKWVPVAIVGLAGVLALLFVHIFVVLLLATAAFFLVKGLAEWALGPGTRIRLNIPWSKIKWPRAMDKRHSDMTGK